MKRVSLNCVISHEKSSRLISLHAHVFHNLVRNQPQYTSKISARKNAGDAYNNQAEEELPGPSRSNPNESLNDETGMTYDEKSKFELLNFMRSLAKVFHFGIYLGMTLHYIRSLGFPYFPND